MCSSSSSSIGSYRAHEVTGDFSISSSPSRPKRQADSIDEVAKRHCATPSSSALVEKKIVLPLCGKSFKELSKYVLDAIFPKTSETVPSELKEAERVLIERRLEKQMRIESSVFKMEEKLSRNLRVARIMNQQRSFAPEMLDSLRFFTLECGTDGKIKTEHLEGVEGGYSFFENGIAACTLQGRRKAQEDRYAVHRGTFRDTSFLISSVFDGHGGSATAQFAQDRLAQILYDNLRRQNESGLTDLGIYNALNLTLSDLSLESASKKITGGTTASVVLEIDNKIWCVNAGDSRSLLLNSEGMMVPLSFDANYASGLFEKVKKRGGRVYRDESYVWRAEHPFSPQNQGVNMATAVGDHFFGAVVSPRGKVVCIERPKSGWIVQFTDGVVFSNTEVAELLLNSLKVRSLQESVIKVVAASLALGSDDNITIMARPLLSSKALS